MSDSQPNLNESFAHEWRAEVLRAAPMIAPARQFVYPHQVAGEEDALARGALLVTVRPPAGGDFLATCALGFSDPKLPSGVWSCPNPREMCAVAGGYAYVVDTREPERSTFISLRPAVEVLPVLEAGLLVFVGFHSLLAWGKDGVAWQTARLSWEGVSITSVVGGGELRGLGWNMHTDREVEFVVDLATGKHTGGGF